MLKKNTVKFVTGILCLLLFIPFIKAQAARISIEHTGYGKTNREAHFSIYNTGDTRITNIKIMKDGEEYKIFEGGLSPGNGFETFLFLDPGKHFIEVKTTEGAYDSLNITISSVEERPFIPTLQGEVKSFSQKSKILIVIVLLIAIIVILWVLMRKPRIE